jgi:hypothetical protein
MAKRLLCFLYKLRARPYLAAPNLLRNALLALISVLSSGLGPCLLVTLSQTYSCTEEPTA